MIRVLGLEERVSRSGSANITALTGEFSGEFIVRDYGASAATSANITVDTTAGSAPVGDDNRNFVISTSAQVGETVDIHDTFNAMTARSTALEVTHSGSGDTGASVTLDTTAGALVSPEGAGIKAEQKAVSLDGPATLSITTADVFGTRFGIDAITQAVGPGGTDMIITTMAGSIRGGADGAGIRAVNERMAGATTLTVGDLQGGESGIRARTLASGGLFITGAPDASGVLGESESGIEAHNEGSGETRIIIYVASEGATVSGGTQGIFASHASTEAFTLDVQGGIVSNLDGRTDNRAITARSDARGVSLTIGQQGTVIGTLDLTGATISSPAFRSF